MRFRHIAQEHPRASRPRGAPLYHGVSNGLFVVDDVGPLQEQVLLLRVALDGLGGGDDGNPALDVGLREFALRDEQVEVLVGQILVAGEAETGQGEQQVGAGCVSGAVALSGVDQSMMYLAPFGVTMTLDGLKSPWHR